MQILMCFDFPDVMWWLLYLKSNPDLSFDYFTSLADSYTSKTQNKFPNDKLNNMKLNLKSKWN